MKSQLLLIISFLLATVLISSIECSRDRDWRRARNRYLHRAVDEEDDDAVEEKQPKRRPKPSPDSDSDKPNTGRKWVTDGSEELIVSGSKVTCDTNHFGDKFNAMWKAGQGIKNGEHYWEIELTDVEDYGGVAVGLTNDENFNKRGKTLGLLYGGHLFNGEKQLVDDYGPQFKDGDTIGILASLKDPEKLQVYYYYNRRSLGLAFDIDSSYLRNARPMVQFKTAAVATIKKVDKVPPPPRKRVPVQGRKGIVGNWKVLPDKIVFKDKQFNIGGLNNGWGSEALVTLKITAHPGEEEKFDSLLRVRNEHRFDIIPTKEPNRWIATEGSTTLLPIRDPKLKMLENNLFNMTRRGNVKTENKNLVLSKSRNSAAFERYEPDPAPFTGNPFGDTSEKPTCYCPCSQDE